MSVFLVDDSQVVISRLRRMLTELDGVTIAGQAGDASSAVAGIMQTRPDAVILDLHLAASEGISVIRDIRASGLVVVIIVLTNYPYAQYRDVCLDAGADYFFDKSADFERVIPIVQELARRVR